jgi:hypothetical protein
MWFPPLAQQTAATPLLWDNAVAKWPEVLSAAKTYGSVFYDKLSPRLLGEGVSEARSQEHTVSGAKPQFGAHHDQGAASSYSGQHKMFSGLQLEFWVKLLT